MPVAYVIHMQRRCKTDSSIVQVEDRIVVQEESITEDPEGRGLCLSLRDNLEEAFEVLPRHIA